MRLALGYDHAGYEAASDIRSYMTSLGHEVVDLGPSQLDPLDDFPDSAQAVVDSIYNHESERGVLICGTGLGMSIAANRHAGIRAIVGYSPEVTRLGCTHNDANILCLGSRTMDHSGFHETIDIFLTTDFLGGKYQQRNEKIENISGCDKSENGGK